MRFTSSCFPRRKLQKPMAWVAMAVLIFSGCTRTKYRLQADAEAYHTIAERNNDPRWFAPNVVIEGDTRSRYFDVYDLDHPPMPLDDPASHQYMRVVDGKRGWKYWLANGERLDLENPGWPAELRDYVDTTSEGAVKLDVDSALRVAYVNSPLQQRQLETLYLSALDVSAERFRLDTQFFGGYNTAYAHQGGLSPARIEYSRTLNRFVLLPPFDDVESNLLSVGRPSRDNPALSASRRFATAGELLVGFANSFVFEFTGSDTNLAASLANFTFVQPLLRGAGRDIALEDLTQSERDLLANLRAYSQFRQGFFTNVAIGELGVNGPQRTNFTTNLLSFNGQGGVGGYLGLLQSRQQIRNAEDNLDLQLRTLDLLEALYDNELIDIVQVDQFRQNIQTQRSNLLATLNSFELDLDRFKTNTLGMPPDLEIELDESLIQQFQLIPREAIDTIDKMIKLQQRVGDVAELKELLEELAALLNGDGGLNANAEEAAIRQILATIQRVTDTVENRVDGIKKDLATLEERGRQQPFSDAEQALIDLVQQARARQAQADQELADKAQAANPLDPDALQCDPEPLQKVLQAASNKLEEIQDEFTGINQAEILAKHGAWLRKLLQLLEGCVQVQAIARNLDGEPEKVVTQAAAMTQPIREIFELTRQDLFRMQEAVPTREGSMNEEDIKIFCDGRKRLLTLFSDLKEEFEQKSIRLEDTQENLGTAQQRDTLRDLVTWVADILEVVNRLALIPAQARLEAITVEPIDLAPESAFEIALANRLDFMNGRAALVDSWREIQVNADALQSVLNVRSSGDLRTARNNPVSFRAPTGSVRMSLEFDAPLTRLLERNAYRESLIAYQRDRRQFIQSRDSLHLGLRALLRNLDQLRENLEIQRRAVAIALRRVDQTQLALNPARPPVPPGQRLPINPTTAINLLGAQTSLRDSQNAFLAAWVNFYATRMRLYRELGIMQLDPEGQWVEVPIDVSATEFDSERDELDTTEEFELEEVPPPLPDDLSFLTEFIE